MFDRLLSRAGFYLVRRGFKVPFSAKIRQFDEYATIRDLLAREKVDFVFDVGAFEGWFGQHMRWLGYRGDIVSFEPNPKAFEVLEQAAAHDPKWHVVNCALGPESGQMAFNIYSEKSVMNSFRDRIGIPAKSVQTVRVEALDDIMSRYVDGQSRPRIFLKLDTQGYDGEVLSGARAFLEDVVVLQSEISVIPLYREMPHFTESLAHYEELGFQLEDLFVVSRRGSRVVEYDCLMTKADPAPQSAG